MSAQDDNKVVAIGGTRAKDKKDEPQKGSQEQVYCSFCAKPNNMVLKLIKGPGVNICSECVMICIQYLLLEDHISDEAKKVLNSLWQGVKK